MMRPIEGFFASRNPYAVQVSGPIAFRAGLDGLAVSRFGWGSLDTGFVDNVRSDPAQVLAYVFPFVTGNSAIRVCCGGARFVRPGVGVTFLRSGDYWVRFQGGAQAGQPVYASLVDGSPISGQATNAELTRWFVATNAAPGGLAIISTTTKVTT